MITENFDKEAFIDWYRNNKISAVGSGIATAFLQNLIGYGLVNKNYSKDQLAGFLWSVIPYIDEPAEVAQFCDESILTSDMIAEVKLLKDKKNGMKGA